MALKITRYQILPLILKLPEESLTRIAFVDFFRTRRLIVTFASDVFAGVVVDDVERRHCRHRRRHRRFRRPRFHPRRINDFSKAELSSK